MDRQDYIKHVGNYRSAIEFESQALSAASEFLPLPARAVRDGGEPTPAYWEWLIEQYIVPEAPRPEGETVDARIARLGLKVPFFHKQNGGAKPESGGYELDGESFSEFPRYPKKGAWR